MNGLPADLIVPPFYSEIELVVDEYTQFANYPEYTVHLSGQYIANLYDVTFKVDETTHTCPIIGSVTKRKTLITGFGFQRPVKNAPLGRPDLLRGKMDFAGVIVPDEAAGKILYPEQDIIRFAEAFMQPVEMHP